MTVENPGRETAIAGVPFVDLGLMHAGIRDAVLQDFAALIDTGAFANGPAVAELERAFAAYVGTDDAIGVASGLDALRLGMQAAGLEPGAEAIVPANTFIATVEAIAQAGARPVLVDATEDDYDLDIAAATAAIGPRTRFLVPVHLYGQVADMRGVLALAGRHELVVVEDACQAHGASRDGLTAGAAGAIGAFSFYPGKNLGAFGDAGAATTSDPAIAAGMRVLREHGQRVKYDHVVEGWTARLDTIQALVLLRKLPLLDGWNRERRAVAAAYADALAGLGDLALPPVPAGSEPVWHLYPVRTRRRAELQAFLGERGIATGRHYPQPIHLAPAYAHLGYRPGAFPVSEALAEELVSLPIFPGMTEAQVAAVADGIARFFAGG